jgi:TRAP-type C4-dicarboxylate transport system permease small subunit
MTSVKDNNGASPTGSAVMIDEHTGGGDEALPLALAPGGAAIDALTRALALAGGTLLLVAVVLTLVSVAGRYLFLAPVPGDYELVEIICGIAVFLFFPFTHAQGSNLKAEFFTSGVSLRQQRMIDVAHDVIFAIIGVLLTWRMVHAFEEKMASGETSILVGVPLWWGYGIGLFSLALLTLVCFLRVYAGIRFVGQPANRPAV